MTDEHASPTVTEDDIGLPVVDTDWTQVGTVADVEGGTVSVSPDPDAADDARATLGWSEVEDVTYPLDVGLLERVETDGGTVFQVDLGVVNQGEPADRHEATGGADPE